jgi:hypothetical protein
MAVADDAVLGFVQRVILDPRVTTRALDQAIARLSGRDKTAESLDRQVAVLDEEISRLVAAIASGGSCNLAAAIRGREARRASLFEQQQSQRAVPAFNPKTVRHDLTVKIADWQSLLKRQREPARKLLDLVLYGRLVLTPKSDERGPYYEFRGKGSLLPALAPALPLRGTSPAGFEPAFWP